MLHEYLFEVCGKEESEEILHLWSDNTVRENKNFFLFGYLHLLVHYGFYSCINFNFNIVGHTHTTIDALEIISSFFLLFLILWIIIMSNSFSNKLMCSSISNHIMDSLNYDSSGILEISRDASKALIKGTR